MYALFDPDYILAHKQKLDNIGRFFLGWNAQALSDGLKISLMESSLVSMWVASAIKSKCSVEHFIVLVLVLMDMH